MKLTINANQVKCWFLRRGETGVPGEIKPLGATNSTHMTPNQGIKPGPHWWEASTLTTAPSLHPRNTIKNPDWQGQPVGSLQKYIINGDGVESGMTGNKSKPEVRTRSEPWATVSSVCKPNALTNGPCRRGNIILGWNSKLYIIIWPL